MANVSGKQTRVPSVDPARPVVQAIPRVEISTQSTANPYAGQAAAGAAQMLEGINARIRERLDIQAAALAAREGTVSAKGGAIPALRDESTIRGAAFNRAAKDAVITENDLALRIKLSDLETANKADPVKFAQGARAFWEGMRPSLEQFDPAVAQELGAGYSMRMQDATERITSRQQAIARDRMVESALILQMRVQSDLEEQASRLFNAPPDQVMDRIENMNASAMRLEDIGGQFGPDGTPLFSARERVGMREDAQDSVGRVIGMAWMSSQSDPVAAWRTWKGGKAEIEVARDGISTRVSIADMIGPHARAAVEKSFIENLRSSLSLDASIAQAQDRQFRQQSDAVWSDLSILAQDGGLSLSTVEAARSAVEPDKYLALREMAKKGGPSVSDGAEIARLSVDDSNGVDIRSDLKTAYSEGKMTREDFVRMYDRNTDRLSQGVQNAVSAGRDYVENSLGKLSSELGFMRSIYIPQASAEYELRVQDFIREKGRQPSHPESIAIAREVTLRYSLMNVESSVAALPLPRFLSPVDKARSAFGVQDLAPVVQKTRDFYLGKHGGDEKAMEDDPEYQGEATLLKMYYDRLKQKEQNDAASPAR